LEQTDPDYFYRAQAADTVAQLRRYSDLADRVVVDVGGGAGYFSTSFAAAGARCVLVEPEAGSAARSALRPPSTPPEPRPDRRAEPDRRAYHQWAVTPGRLVPGRTVAGDGNRMPLPDGVADVTFSSNVLEHVPDPSRFIDEMVRVTRPGGTIYLSFTAWWSPWGGHETAPWHYLGGHRAARRYERRNGRPPGNRYGTSLFACHVGTVLRLTRSHPGVDVVDALPRYYPDWMRWVIHVPALREIVTWNLLVILRRRGLAQKLPSREDHRTVKPMAP
jgi:arabinofuranan 3-O-arabinosyltransferase